MESILAQSDESKAFVKELCFEYTQEAASLWLLRGRAVCAPHYNLTDLLQLDRRLEAQIDALRVAGEPGWETAVSQIKNGRTEYFFAPSILAFESNDEDRIGMILEKAVFAPDLSEGMISALGWLTWEQALPHIKNLLTSNSSVHQYIGITASAQHRQDPGPYLDTAFYAQDPKLKARSVRALGEMGGRRGKLTTGYLQDELKSPDEESRFWAAWSSVLSGNAEALSILTPFVVDSRYPFQEQAMQLALRCVDRITALALHDKLTQISGMKRMAIIGAGVIGDTVMIPWVIDMMRIPAQARLAGETFAMITGVDIVEENLEGLWPEGFEAGPNDDPKDDNVEPDPDENLPWPDEKRITAWWEKNKGQYQKEMRLLLGKRITEEHLTTILQTGFQKQRAAAALELALLKPGKPLFNTHAPTQRQMDQIQQIRKENKPKSWQPAANIVLPAVVASPAVPVNYGKRELVITAVNSITPLGHNAAMTAASVRAGITRFVISDGYQDRNGNPIIVANINGIRDNVENVFERLRDIAVIGLKYLIDEYLFVSYHRPPQVHFFFGVPSGARPGPDIGKNCTGLLESVFIKQLGNPVSEVIQQGNASLPYAIGEAAKVIQSRPDTLCIIGCIDSLLKKTTLSWFESEGRLKSSSYGRNQSLIAAEAVCFLIVEDRERAIQNNRPILARICTLGLAEEPKSRASDTSGISAGLSEACHAAVAPLKDRDIQAVFGDLNGEDSRAEEWSIAEMRCLKRNQQRGLWMPAFRYGDIGAASGAVMTGIVAEGFKRNWLPSPVLVFCSDDHGPCGALVLKKHCPSLAEGARSDRGGETP